MIILEILDKWFKFNFKRKMKHIVYLLLGSNMGDSISFLSSARIHISQQIGEISKSSSIFRTEPWSMDTEQWFHNQVLEIKCKIDPDKLLNMILKIEEELGRKRSLYNHKPYESRTIDIDILYYDNKVLNSDNLVIPHPRIQERRFVLKPMCEIAPSLIHPVLGKNQSDLLNICTDHSIIERI